jgi:rare lipoprotein A
MTRLHAPIGAVICLIGFGLGGFSASAAQEPQPSAAKPNARAASGHQLDRSGQKRVGKASRYARRFAGRKMADGTPMDPRDDNAASKSLPLGTRAKVTNRETGQSTNVTIQDRGPYVRGRIVDLSPATADKIGVTPQKGVAPVEVAPITVPQPDGSVKPGAAAK